MESSPTNAFSWPIRVYFEDTDATGVVYHANYLRYFERARSEWLRARGFTHDVLLRDHNAVFTLSEVAVKYLKPARLGDALEVRVSVESRSRITLTFAQTICRAEQPEQILTKARVTVVCVHAETFKPRAWPAGWLND